MKSKEDVRMYRTLHIRIKPGHRFFGYCDKMCYESKNLYNSTNYHFRQVFSGFSKEQKNLSMHTNEIEVIDSINESIPKLNEVKDLIVSKRRRNELLKPLDERKEIKDPNYYKRLDHKNKYLNYNLIDAYFRFVNQVDFVNLASQVNQQTIKLVLRDWKSFFEGLKAYEKGSGLGLPKPPKYVKKNGRKVAVFTNQVCKIKYDKYLRFPKTDLVIDIKKYGKILNGEFKEARIHPGSNFYTVEVVFDVGEMKELTHAPSDVLGIDLGINNFATVVNNVGKNPIIVDGKVLKSINQYYNKKRSKLTSILRNGMSKNQGDYSSKRLRRLDEKRNAKVKDFLHKASRTIVEYAKELGIDTIIIGNNKNIKQGINIGKVNNQKFTNIPFKKFMDILEYKCLDEKIKLIVTEESYTSKASFLDNDEIPIYEVNRNEKYVFSGKRVKRGLYRTKEGLLINADINGAANIVKKVVPDAFSKGNRGVMETPIRIRVA